MWNDGISRRQFLQAGAATGVAAGLTRSKGTLAQSPKVLRARAYAYPEILDPAYFLSINESDIMRSLFGGLVTYKTGSEWGWEKEFAAEIVPESPTRIRFQLRPGIPWSGGFGEVTAEDVKFSYERIAQPERKSPYRNDWDQLDTVEVTGAHSGTIILKAPFAPLWESTLPATSGMIVCKKAVEALSGQRFTSKPPAISGPYRIQRYDPQRAIVLERNPLWTGSRPNFDEIHFISILDGNAAEIAYLAGELDYTPQLPISAVTRLKAKPISGSTLLVRPSLAFWWLGMQSEDGVFKDIRVRRAVQLAIDVEDVLEGAFFGAAERATGIIAPGLIGHRPKNKIDKPDRAQARKLLADAGYPSGFKTTIIVRNSGEYVNAGQVVAGNLSEIGITAEVTPVDPSAQRAMARGRAGEWKQMAIYINRFSMQPDPVAATTWFTTSQVGEWNYSRFSNKEFDDLHAAALREQDRTKRSEMYHRMQDIMEESGSFVFLTHGVNVTLHRDNIRPAVTPDGAQLNFAKFGLA